MSGENVWNILGGSSKKGTNSVSKKSVVNNAVDHGTVTVGESIWCSGEGTRE